MNRKERRKLASMQTNDADTLVPVFCGRHPLDMVGPERLRHLLKAKNVKPVRRHRDQKIVELQVQSLIHDEEGKIGEGLPSKGGNASTESDDNQTEFNPRGVWKLRRRAS